MANWISNKSADGIKQANRKGNLKLNLRVIFGVNIQDARVSAKFYFHYLTQSCATFSLVYARRRIGLKESKAEREAFHINRAVEENGRLFEHFPFPGANLHSCN